MVGGREGGREGEERREGKGRVGRMEGWREAFLTDLKMASSMSGSRSLPELIPLFCLMNCSTVIFILALGLCRAVFNMMMEKDRIKQVSGS